VAGRLFVGSQRGKVYSLDSSSGCTHWGFAADKPCVQALSSASELTAGQFIFGDLGGNVYAVEREDRQELWKTRIEHHPAARVTGLPALVGAMLLVLVLLTNEGSGANPTYPCCSFRGVDRNVAVEGHTIVEEAKPTAMSSAGIEMMGKSGAGIWSRPTFNSVTRRVYVTAGDCYSDPPTDTSALFSHLTRNAHDRSHDRRSWVQNRLGRVAGGWATAEAGMGAQARARAGVSDRGRVAKYRKQHCCDRTPLAAECLSSTRGSVWAFRQTQNVSLGSRNSRNLQRTRLPFLRCTSGGSAAGAIAAAGRAGGADANPIAPAASGPISSSSSRTRSAISGSGQPG
jgi:outer membrane protein assembly factor BamB